MNRRIQELDAFRGIAALGVAVHHLTYKEYKGSLLALGNTGVDLFFILSGYVIFLTINHTRVWQDFVVSRFARLYPTYWATLLFTLSLYLIFRPGTVSLYTVFWNVTMFQSLGNAAKLDPSYWTLGVELTFYFLILLAFLGGQLKRIEIWGALLMVLILGIHTVLPILSNTTYNLLTERIEFVNHAPLFFVGILFYTIQHKGNILYRHVLIGLSILLLTLLHYKGHTWNDISKTQHIMMMLVYISVFYLFIFGKMRWIVTPVTLYFGKISYSLYLLHFHLGNNVLIPFFTRNYIPFFVALLLTLLSCILLATVFNRYIENPTNDYIKKWYKSRKATQQVARLNV